MMKKVVVIALAVVAAAVAASPSQAAFSDYGLESVNASLSTSQAGAHPDLTFGFTLKTDPASPVGGSGLHEPYANTRDITVGLPPGLIGNPHAVAQCTPAQLFTGKEAGAEGCPQDSQIGITKITTWSDPNPFTEAIFNMVPPPGAPAMLGLYAAGFPTLVKIGVRSEGDYGLNSMIEGLPQLDRLVKAQTTIWAVPASSAHDTERLTILESFAGATHSPPRPSGLPQELPFLQNPTRCGQPLSFFVETDSYQEPGRSDRKEAVLPPMSGCGDLRFEPEFSATPTTREAAAPSGLDAELSLSQDETLTGRATGQLRDAKVTFPPGMTLAAGAAEGLEACSDSQVGYHVSPPPPSACPAASKLGTAEFDVPQLPRTIEGAVYQRTPASGDLFRVWLVSDELGIHVKIPGDIQLNPLTGQVTSLFLDSPEVPLRNLRLHVFGGPHGPFATPSTCGTYQTHFEFTPWSGTPPAVGDTPMTIDSGCATGGFSPKMTAGSTNPTAGAFSPFTLILDRSSNEQNISSFEVHLPKGLTAKLAGVPLCPEALAATGGCSADSAIGSAMVASGPGPSPLWLPQAGREPISIYLAGPYKGAPYSLVVKAPAQAGPFDLGTVVVRQALYVDPETAQVTAKSDPLPQILQGVPITYRTLYAKIDRHDFILNPTNCKATRVMASVTSSLGAVATPSSPFQVGDCASLGFKPKLRLKLSGATKRTGFPALRAVASARKGDANIAFAQVALPHSEFLEQGHIRTICTRVQFAADACPSAAIYGHARAITPLLDQPLEGPVYLRSSNHPLPDLVADLRGSIHVVLVGRIDSVRGGIRTSFEGVPDAPVSKFVLRMQGGKKGLLTNSTNLCGRSHRAKALFKGQNGKVHAMKPVLSVSCGGGRHHRPHKR